MTDSNSEKMMVQRMTRVCSQYGFIEFDDHTALVCPLPQMLKFGLERVVKADEANDNLDDEQLGELLEVAIDAELN